MKKHLFYLGSLALMLTLICLQKLSAQNTSPFWSLAGNNNATFKSKLGTTNNVSLRFYTNNVQRAILDSLGRMGLGTNAPAAKLHAVQTAASSTAVYGQSTGAGSYGVWGAGVTRGVFGSTTTGYGVYGQSATGTGVFGQGGTYGVYGNSTVSSGRGVYGNATGTSSAGVYGNNTNSSGIGVHGVSSQYIGVQGDGNGYGVYGFASSTLGTGVWGDGFLYGVVGNIIGSSSGTGVFGDGPDYGTYDSSTNNGYGVYGVSGTSSVIGRATTGVYGKGFYGVRGDGGPYGVYGTGTSYGVEGIGVDGVVGLSNIPAGTGVFGLAQGGSSNGNPAIGVYAYTSTTGYGVKAYCNQGTGTYTYSDHNYGLYCYTNGGGYAAYFAGQVFSTGGFVTSDKRLKQNISDMTDAMDIINKLQPKYYEYRQDGDYKLMHMPTGKHFGLIAQDVEQLLPDLVKESEFDPGMINKPQQTPVNGNLAPDGKTLNVTSDQAKQEPASTSEKFNFKAINYTELIPVLVKGIQEQQQQINKQQQEIDQLKETINKLTLGQGINTIADNSVLEQNTPNPVNRSTSIRYSVPQGTSSAQLILTDNLGKTIKTLRLGSAGTINLDTSTLSSGVYNYSLIINGRVVDSKKMTVARE